MFSNFQRTGAQKKTVLYFVTGTNLINNFHFIDFITVFPLTQLYGMVVKFMCSFILFSFFKKTYWTIFLKAPWFLYFSPECVVIIKVCMNWFTFYLFFNLYQNCIRFSRPCTICLGILNILIFIFMLMFT